MRINPLTDLVVNTALPLFSGTLIYFLGNTSVKNYLPDGLWAYALTSVILIIWNRGINFLWVILVILLSAGFELLQYFHLVPGTGDVADAIVYLLSIAIALVLNRLFKNLYSNKPNYLVYEP